MDLYRANSNLQVLTLQTLGLTLAQTNLKQKQRLKNKNPKQALSNTRKTKPKHKSIQMDLNQPSISILTGSTSGSAIRTRTMLEFFYAPYLMLCGKERNGRESGWTSWSNQMMSSEPTRNSLSDFTLIKLLVVKTPKEIIWQMLFSQQSLKLGTSSKYKKT